MNRLSPLAQRLIAVAVLLGLGAVTWHVAARPLLTWRERSAVAIETMRRQVVAHQRLAAAEPELEEALARLSAVGAERAHYLEGASDAVAGAALESRVVEAIAQAGGRTRSSRTVATETEEGFRRIGIAVDFSIDATGLLDVVRGLEGGVPFVRIDRLDLRSTRSERAADGPTEEPPLAAAIQVRGYALDE
jgi:hypothetical protein